MKDEVKEIWKLLGSDDPKTRCDALRKLRKLRFKGEKRKSETWKCIRKALEDHNGNVRMGAYYAARDEIMCLGFGSDTFGLKIMEELYDMSKKQKDKKVRFNILRCIVGMECLAFEYLARDNGMLERYLEIMDYAHKETNGRYEQPKNEFREIMECFARQIEEKIRDEPDDEDNLLEAS